MKSSSDKDIQCEVFIAGGGLAGVSAALAAARCGSKVILCQDRPVLGGNASSEVRMHIVGANGMQEGIPLVCEAREGGIVEEIRLEQCVRNPQRSASMMDLCLYDLCRSEPNLTLLLNCTVLAAETEGPRIIEVVADRPSTMERFTIRAVIYVDCTGDSALGQASGASFWMGREGKDAFGESFAPHVGDTHTLGSTLLYQARRHLQPMPFTAPTWARRIEAEDLKLRPYAKPGTDMNLEYGFWWLEWGGHLDTIRDNEIIRDELLAILMGVWDFIKNRADVDASHWALEWCGFLPGKRESRRLQGQYVLTEQDLLQSRVFPDAIATGGWPIDTHPPHGIDAVNEPPCVQRLLPYLYDIPLRSCVSNGIDNLMFAGRNISASHIAFASTRVMGTCSAIGQGVGTAAAYAARRGLLPTELSNHEQALHAVRQQLLRDGALLLRHANQDPRDHARRSTVTASSAQREGPPQLIVNGWTRSLHQSEHSFNERPITSPPGAFPKSVNRWMSKPGGTPVPFVELSWEELIHIAVIELTFDTGMHRLLTLSMADGYTQRMIWGKPQPETVRDFRISAYVDECWNVIADVEGNYQRRRVIMLAAPVTTSRLRVHALKTNGLDHARLFEIRIYSPTSCGSFLENLS